MNEIEQAIIKTLAYFEQFGRALTADELHQLLWQQKCAKPQVIDQLHTFTTTTRPNRYLSYDRRNNISESERLFSLSKESLIKTKERETLLNVRRETALKIAEIISKFDGVVSVIAMNSLAMQTIKTSSDLDFLIIVKPGQLYTTRFNALLKLKNMGLAKSKNSYAGKACLGYWLSEDSLDVGQYQSDEMTAAYWIATMVPLYGIEGYRSFVKANEWVYQYLPNWCLHTVAHLEPQPHPAPLLPGEGGRRPGEVYKNIVEIILFLLSRAKILMDREFRNSEELVVTKSRLKLHSVDNRRGYGKRAQEIVSRIVG